MIKKLFWAIAMAAFSTSVFAQQVKEVALMVSGDGATKQEATQNALRSAIEQAFGVFVSANTSILDDELVKDEIATISSGNIKEYKEIVSAILPGGNVTVTLKAIVSPSKLAAYAKSKGSSVEFAGAAFGMGMRLKELNKANEEKAIINMLSQLMELVPAMFDYKLKAGEPEIHSRTESHQIYGMNASTVKTEKDPNFYDIPVVISVIFNETTEMATNILTNTLTALSMSENERKDYKKVGLAYSKLAVGNYIHNNRRMSNGDAGVGLMKAKFKNPGEVYLIKVYTKYLTGYKHPEGTAVAPRKWKSPDIYYLRSRPGTEQLANTLNAIFSNAISNFQIETNTGKILYKSTPSINDNRYEDDSYGLVSRNDSDENVDYSRIIAAQHLFKAFLAKVDGDLIPYKTGLRLKIPKDEIMEISNITIKPVGRKMEWRKKLSDF
jgi:hypothetical protein